MEKEIQAGQELMLGGNYYEAQDIFLAILRDDPANDEALYHLGLCHLASENLGEAESCFRKCLEVNPRNIDALIDLGEVEFAKADPEQAILSFSAALAMDADNARALISMARIQDFLGMDDAAVENFERAMALSDPMDAPAYDLSLAYAKVGKYLRADIILDDLITDTLRRGTQNFSVDVSPGAREELMEYLSEMKEDRDNIRSMYQETFGHSIEIANFMYQGLLIAREIQGEVLLDLLREIRILRYMGLDLTGRSASYRLQCMDGNFSGQQLLCLEYAFCSSLELDQEIDNPDMQEAYSQALTVFD